MDWATRALNHARLLANASPGRGSATRSEAQAAEYVRKHLSGMGFRETHLETFDGLRSIWFFLALVFGIALMGHLAYWLLQPALGVWLAWGLSALAFGLGFYLLWLKFTYQDFPLRDNLPHGSSQNVLAVTTPQQEMRRKVVLVAHLDSHRAVIWFAADALVTLYALVSPLVVYSVAAAPVFYALLNLTGLSVFGWLGAVTALLHFVGWFTGVSADLGVFSPGANDNASAVGTVLALAERLQAEPLQHTEVWLVFTGCEETGCDGMRNLLDRHEEALKEAFFLNFELVGIGTRLAYLQSEGIVRKRRISSDTRRILAGVEERFPLLPVSGAVLGVFTDMGVVWEKGYHGACLLMLREDSHHLPEWHRMSDTSERLELGAMQKMHACAWELLQDLDVGEPDRKSHSSKIPERS